MSPRERTRLPLAGTGERQSSLRTDGGRNRVYPADVAGRFIRARRLVFAALIVLWAALPWIPVGGNPAVFVDIEHRRFFLFGLTFNAQDLFLLFFLASGVAFALVAVTAVVGRAFCGWACPQTVFLEAIFRPIERLIGGPREKRMRLHAGAWSGDRTIRAVVTQALYVLASLLIAHIVLAYFISLPRLWAMMGHGPRLHPEAFAWMLGISAFMYGNFAWFREQMCVVLCPYGRLQSVLLDDDSLVVGYDERRGEPRGKASSQGAGDCVDCNRCVVVCPTGIDIRNGLQVDCVACAQCIDACDAIMDRLGRARGLIRYDSLRGLRGEAKRFLRPRLFVYGALLAAGVCATALGASSRQSYEANLLRLASAAVAHEGTETRNALEIHIVNKRSVATKFFIGSEEAPGRETFIAQHEITLDPLAGARIPIAVRLQDGAPLASRMIRLTVRAADGDSRTLTMSVLGAR